MHEYPQLDLTVAQIGINADSAKLRQLFQQMFDPDAVLCDFAGCLALNLGVVSVNGA